MGRLTNRLKNQMGDDPKRDGLRRSLRGLREGNDRELYLGLALTVLSYLRSTKPRKELIYRKTVSEGSALVIHHKRTGTPRLEIIKPKRR
jgi:hypothetical protein